jgi:hypothetical protein
LKVVRDKPTYYTKANNSSYLNTRNIGVHPINMLKEEKMQIQNFIPGKDIL